MTGPGMAKQEDYVIAHGERRALTVTPPPSFFDTLLDEL